MRPTRFADINAMRAMGIREEVLRLLRRIGLGTMPTKQYDLFPDLVRQFLATARVYYTNEVVKRAQEGTLTFLVRGVRYRLPLVDLCGIYGFKKEPTGVALPAQFHDVQPFWSYFGNGRYDSKTSTQTDVRHPVLRYVARLLSNTILCKMEPGKMRLSELILLYYAVGHLIPEEDLEWPELDRDVNMGAIFAHHLVSLKTKPFLGKGTKIESVGSLLTPIFQHFRISTDSCSIVTARSLMNEEHLKSAKWIKPQWRWYFRSATGEERLIQLPQRELTTLGDDPLLLRFQPDQSLLIAAAPPRLRRGASSRAPAASTEDDPAPDRAGGSSHRARHSFSSAPHAPPTPSLPVAPPFPMESETFQRYVADSFQSIWAAISTLSRCGCIRPSRARSPTPPVGPDDVDEED